MSTAEKTTVTEHNSRFSSLEVVAPYDLEHICEVEMQSWPAVDEHLEQAYQLHHQADTCPPLYNRLEILKKATNKLEEKWEDFAYLIAQEGGKPITDARIEVKRAIQGIHHAISTAPDILTGRVIPGDLNRTSHQRSMVTQKEPIGVVVTISAFNHPLNLIIHQVIPAIAAGCPVIAKPASTTPLTCLKLMGLLYEAGLKEDWCRCVVCDDIVAEQLATDPRVGFVSFIGSARVGWHLRSKLAPGTRCALEHGGNAPAILLPTADYDTALPALLKGGMTHAGQICVSTQRIYAPWTDAANIARTLGELAGELVVGNPLNDTTDVGPLILPREVDRIEQWVTEATSGGGTLIKGGKRLSETVYAPTILLSPPANAKVTHEEIFGPVICVYGYDEVEDAIALANDSNYAFQTAVWGKEDVTLQRVIDGLNASTVMVNDHTAFRVDWMPFGGRNKSGLGTGGIPYTIADYLQEKLVVRHIP